VQRSFGWGFQPLWWHCWNPSVLAAFGIPILMMVASQKHQCNGIRLCILYTITINIYIYIYIYVWKARLWMWIPSWGSVRMPWMRLEQVVRSTFGIFTYFCRQVDRNFNLSYIDMSNSRHFLGVRPRLCMLWDAAQGECESARNSSEQSCRSRSDHKVDPSAEGNTLVCLAINGINSTNNRIHSKKTMLTCNWPAIMGNLIG